MEDSYSLDEWVIATLGAQRILNNKLFQKSDKPHPAVAIQLATDEVFRPSSPMEVYSDERPFFVPQDHEQEDWIPIDVLLGRYIPTERKIKVFRLNIEQYSRHPFNCTAEDLEFIVRMHEYCHALLHLGISLHYDRNLLASYPNGRETTWDGFVSSRNAVSSSIDEATHEFLAQTLGWCALNALHSYKAGVLPDLFLKLMEKQPPLYRVSAEVLDKALSAKWAVVLGQLRETEGIPLPKGTTLKQAIESLLIRTILLE